MARKTKKTAEAVTEGIAVSTALEAAVPADCLEDNEETGVMTLDDNIAVMSESTAVKCVTLNQLYIIKDYINKKAENLLNALVASDSGVHGLRYKDGKLQHENADGTWSDIATGDGSDISGGSAGGGLTDSDFATDDEVRDIFKIV
ncbi:MAG: hypothetical protein NC401_18970 [Ruminococcus sp.]|nr:hypothetical protein [Ruminococcus sp.]